MTWRIFAVVDFTDSDGDCDPVQECGCACAGGS